MRARMQQRLAAVECGVRKGRRVARLLEALGLEDAIDDRARLARRQRVGLAGRIDPRNGIEQSEEEIKAEDADRERPAPPQLRGVLAPEAIAGDMASGKDRADDQQ